MAYRGRKKYKAQIYRSQYRTRRTDLPKAVVVRLTVEAVNNNRNRVRGEIGPKSMFGAISAQKRRPDQMRSLALLGIIATRRGR